MANVISGLTAYVEENKNDLIAKVNLGAKSTEYMNLMTGCKGATTLNLIDSAITFNDGTTCGWNDTTTTTISQRKLEAVPLSINTSVCDKAMLKYFTQSKVAVAAGRKGALPFEQAFVKTLIDGINKGIEKMVWTGTKSATSCDGLITLATFDENTIKAGATGVEATLVDVIKKTPAEILAREGYTIAMGMDKFNELMLAWYNANKYHLPEVNANEVKMPGTNYRILGVEGLNGSDKIFAADFKEVFYGVDMENDAEDLQIWYSKDNQEYRVAANLVAGVQYAFSDQVVIGTIA